MIEVNFEQSKEVGRKISKYKVRENFLSRPFLKIRTEREYKLRAYFYAVAICHQTYNLALPEKELYGWEVIEFVFLDLMSNDPSFFEPGIINTMSLNQLEKKLEEIFGAIHHDKKCTLDRLNERALLLNDFDKKIEKYFGGNISEFLIRCNSSLFNKGEGIYEQLSQFEAFSDPLMKKSSFLIKLLLDANLLRINDPEKFIPIMDYHMQRVLLRTGCVTVRNKELYDKLIRKIPIIDDTQIREACISSIRVIAKESGHSLPSMNDFFWPLGRSCCNEHPLCKIGECEKKPCSLSQLITLEDRHKLCILQNACKGNGDSIFRDLWQPIVETHFY